uniref:C2H2-type domain-containing protein n=1 Tax=Nicotiana tabacum TaxID=4097 RepID=A0A1S3YJP9_TOBAC|nr:PREDICTED: uncharacterized protein LOC107776849 [Nicotiana tabacum]
MAAELGILSQEQQKQQQSPLQPPLDPSSVTVQDDDNSWEVRAFEEDTGNAMGTTWPPRAYTCTFCRREFRSAQALGGQMNVHRRDRARLHQAPPLASNSNHTSSHNANSTLLSPTQEFVTNGGLCLLYSLPNPNGPVFNPTSTKSCMNNNLPSTFLSISPFPTNNLMSPYPPPPSLSFLINRPSPINTSFNISEPLTSNTSNDNNHDYGSSKRDSAIEEELDLEL